LDRSERGKKYFESSGEPKLVANSKGKKRMPNSKDLGTLLRCTDRGFIDFLSRCLRWDVAERITPSDALRHPWVLGEEPAPRTPSSPDTHARRSAVASTYASPSAGARSVGVRGHEVTRSVGARDARNPQPTTRSNVAATGLEEVKMIGRRIY
jgi:dual specificity tyrosine-phosphorylation-regulated kinase 2/3/4